MLFANLVIPWAERRESVFLAQLVAFCARNLRKLLEPTVLLHQERRRPTLDKRPELVLLNPEDQQVGQLT